jgi:tRNA A-37 threonylcarbamoyl transferase component Bud32
VIGEQIGNFEIKSQLGKGGMGEVYLGEHHDIGTRVAVKMLLPHISMNKELVDRFFNEAIAVSKIQHAGTAKIFDVGFHGSGRAYLMMEFLPGETLAARIRRLGKLSLAQVSEIGKQISGVLEAVHKAGITHRDLKPDNIFIVPDDELACGERVKIVDFGIAKLSGAGGGMTATSSGSMGTPAYMSPEQWKNTKNVDWRADAYSLGCLSFEMIAGRPPFIAETIGEACAMHLTEEPPRLASVMSVPPQVDALIASLLEKAPDRRPASMRDIANAFVAIGANVTPVQMASTQMSGHMAIGATLPAASDRAAIANLPTQVTGAAVAPPPPPPHVTTLGGAVGEAPPKPRTDRTLVFAAGALALVGIAFVLAFGFAFRGGDHKPEPRVEQTPPISKPTEPRVEVSKANDPPVRETAPNNQASDPLAGSGSSNVARVAEATPPPPVEREPVPTAFLTITTTPAQAIVQIDGKRVGESPILRLPLPPGPRTITVSGNGRKASKKVILVSGKAHEARFELDAPKAIGEPVPGTVEAPQASSAQPPAGNSNLPASLDRIAIQEGIRKIQGAVFACAAKFPGVHGEIKTQLVIAPSGLVTSAAIRTTPDAGLGACVVAALQRARFARSKDGIKVSYPFTF